jgi:hypothetical protein
MASGFHFTALLWLISMSYAMLAVGLEESPPFPRKLLTSHCNYYNGLCILNPKTFRYELSLIASISSALAIGTHVGIHHCSNISFFQASPQRCRNPASPHDQGNNFRPQRIHGFGRVRAGEYNLWRFGFRRGFRRPLHTGRCLVDKKMKRGTLTESAVVSGHRYRSHHFFFRQLQ